MLCLQTGHYDTVMWSQTGARSGHKFNLKEIKTQNWLEWI